MPDWVKVISAVAPNGKPEIIAGLAAEMPWCIAKASLTSRLRLAHFLGQLAHESDGMRTTVEYASGRAYDWRRDLGNTRPGDGPRFRGRGLIQVTGRANYAAMSKKLVVDMLTHPELAAQFPFAARTAALFWEMCDINRHADNDDVGGVTRVINGGSNGINDRRVRTRRAWQALRGIK